MKIIGDQRKEIQGELNLPTLLCDYLVVRERLNSRLLNRRLEKRALLNLSPRPYMTHFPRLFFSFFSEDSWNSFCSKFLNSLFKSWRMSPYWQMEKSLKSLSTWNICRVNRILYFRSKRYRRSILRFWETVMSQTRLIWKLY